MRYGHVVTRTKDDITVTATFTEGGWDLLAVDGCGRIVAADTLRNYGAVRRAFQILGV